jgi:serine/threonine-protein kinase
MIGRTVLAFRIERQLAEGGMGAVYLARHVLLPRTLKVIKVLLPAYAANEVLRQRFHREAEAASRLKHESILGIDNFGALEDGQLFIMVPYLEGQPLDAYLRARGGRLPPHRALHLVVQLCDALDHAHALGIIHRDLKPGNVYVVATNANPYALKLLDFGIAKIVGSGEVGPKTSSGVAIGTPSYMAVEQYEHADEVTHLADVYSLAIVIWEMVTGRLPWQHPDHALLYYQQRTVIPERPPADVMPPAWAEILLAALSVDPAERPGSARELAVALASALPAVGRVPSGAEILADLAPHFVRKAAPDAETVRNASDVDRIGPLLWPARETAAAAPGDAAADVPREAAADAPRSGEVTAGAPRETEFTQATTLSAATCVASGPTERRSSRWRLALAAAGTAALAAIMTAAIATSVSSGEASSAPASAPASVPTVAEPPRTDERASAAAPRPAAAAPAAAPVVTPAAAASGSARGALAEPKPRVPRPGPAPLRARDPERGARPPARTKSIDPDDVSGPGE